MKNSISIWALMIAMTGLAACSGGNGGNNSTADTPTSVADGGDTDTDTGTDTDTDTGTDTDTDTGTDTDTDTDTDTFSLDAALGTPVFAATPDTSTGSTSLTGQATDLDFAGDFQPSFTVNGEEAVTFADAPVGSANGFNIYQAENALMAASTADQNLDYTVFGVWAQGDVANLLATGTTNVTEAAGFFGGVRGGATPSTGSASYAGSAVAIDVATGGAASDYMTGTMSANVDFGSRDVSVNLDLASARTGDTISLATSGVKINRNSAAFGGDIAGDGFTGSTSGRLLGPNQDEIGGAFQATSSDSTLVGAYGGAKQ